MREKEQFNVAKCYLTWAERDKEEAEARKQGWVNLEWRWCSGNFKESAFQLLGHNAAREDEHLVDLLTRLIEAAQHAEYPAGDPPVCAEARKYLQELEKIS